LLADATEWMAELLLRHPEQSLTILALGPLTNIAYLVQRSPGAAQRLAGIIAMGGAVRDRGNVTPFAEFNIAADPEAAAVVLRSGVPLTLVPLDVTRQVAADPGWGARLAATGGKIATASAAMIEAYLANIARRRAAMREISRAAGFRLVLSPARPEWDAGGSEPHDTPARRAPRAGSPVQRLRG